MICMNCLFKTMRYNASENFCKMVECNVPFIMQGGPEEWGDQKGAVLNIVIERAILVHQFYPNRCFKRSLENC